MSDKIVVAQIRARHEARFGSLGFVFWVGPHTWGGTGNEPERGSPGWNCRCGATNVIYDENCAACNLHAAASAPSVREAMDDIETLLGMLAKTKE